MHFRKEVSSIENYTDMDRAQISLHKTPTSHLFPVKALLIVAMSQKVNS